MEPEQVVKPKKKLLLKVFIGLLIFMLLYLTASVLIVDYIYTQLQFNDHFDYESTADAEDFGLIVNESDLITEDNLKIHVYEVTHEDPKGIVIMLTGITGPSVTHFYGNAQLVAEAGFASLLIDARGHGQSDGDRITFAIEDVKDVNAAVEYIKDSDLYKDKPIIVMGLSMGGATAVNAGSLNDNIDGIIALSPYSSWTEACMEMAENSGYPRWAAELLRPGVLIHGYLNFGVDFFRVVPKETIKQLGDKPILIMRSSKDMVVTINNHERLLQNYNGKNLITFIRDADAHSVVKNDDIVNPFNDIVYCNAILNFLNQYTIEKES